MATSTVMKIVKSRSTHLVNFQPYPTRSSAKEVTKRIGLFPLASLMCVCFMKTNKNNNNIQECQGTNHLARICEI